MAFTDRPWDGSASRWPDAAAYCRACLVDNNPADATKTKDQCHFPVKEPNGDINVNALRAVLGGRGAQADFPGAQAARAEARRLLDQYEGQQGRSENEPDDIEVEELPAAGETFYRACDYLRMVEGDTESDPIVIEGRMMPYDEWAEVRSPIEGHFMEQFARGSLAKTMQEQGPRIKVLFEHGLDFLGRQAIATVTSFEDRPDGAYYRAELLRGLPDLLVDGLRKGIYGSSIRWGPVKWDRRRHVQPSDTNPDALPEQTIREARMKEFSITPFPVYEGATAHVRSLTDEITARKLHDVDEIVELLTARSEPQHSEPEPLDPEPDSTPSRSTQPSRDYLNQKEVQPPWLLE